MSDHHTINGKPFGLSELLEKDAKALDQRAGKQKPLHQRNIIIIGSNGEGKSFLVESDPFCYIFDADGSGSQHPRKKAVRTPHADRADLRTFDAFRQAVDAVIEVKKKHPDAPIRFAVDRIEKLLDLAKAHYAASDPKGRVFDDLDGRRSYPRVYGWIQNSYTRLNGEGIGVTWLASANMTRRDIGNDESVRELGTSMSDGLESRIKGDFDEIFYLSRRTVKRASRTATGKKTSGVEKVTERYMTANPEDVESVSLARVLKNRLRNCLDEIVIPEVRFRNNDDQGAVWENCVVPAYEAAIKKFEDFAS